LRRQDHRHCLRVDQLDHSVRCRCQESIDQVRAGDRFRLDAVVKPLQIAI
jgi:hypothetical protein